MPNETMTNQTNKETFQLGDIGQDEPRHTHRDLPSRITRKNKEFLSMTDLKKGAFWKEVKVAWGPIKVPDKMGRPQHAHGFSFFTVGGVKLINANPEAFLRDYANKIGKNEESVPRLIPRFGSLLSEKGFRMRAAPNKKTLSEAIKKSWEQRRERMKAFGLAGRGYSEEAKREIVTQYLDLKKDNPEFSWSQARKKLKISNTSLRKWLKEFGDSPLPSNGPIKPSLNLLEAAKKVALEEFEAEKEEFLSLIKQEKEKLWKEFRKKS